eukprot:jgi/Chrzof1/6270/UNPLg00848.t1
MTRNVRQGRGLNPGHLRDRRNYRLSILHPEEPHVGIEFIRGWALSIVAVLFMKVFQAILGYYVSMYLPAGNLPAHYVQGSSQTCQDN